MGKNEEKKKKLCEKFCEKKKISTFAKVFAYIWANEGSRETVPHLFFVYISHVFIIC